MKPLQIGDLVLVSSRVEAYYDLGGDRQLVVTPIVSTLAKVVGVTTIKIGSYVPARGSTNSWLHGGDDYEPPSFAVSGTLTVWLVRTGMRNKPLKVRDEDLAPARFEDYPLYNFPFQGPIPREVQYGT